MAGRGTVSIQVFWRGHLSSIKRLMGVPTSKPPTTTPKIPAPSPPRQPKNTPNGTAPDNTARKVHIRYPPVFRNRDGWPQLGQIWRPVGDCQYRRHVSRKLWLQCGHVIKCDYFSRPTISSKRDLKLPNKDKPGTPGLPYNPVKAGPRSKSLSDFGANQELCRG